jgi:hypothetical protein
MSTEPTPEQVVEAVYNFAAEQMQQGVPPPEIERNLIEQGLDADVARTVVGNLLQARSKAVKEAGQKNVLYGALWCAGGILVTVLTYSAAAEGGGTYVVAWGAILFGGIQLVRGLIQSSGE